ISAELNQVITVLTADCMPVFFCNRAGNIVGVAHAGWRGLCAGVLENTVQALCEKSLALGQTLAREDILVWLGPAIGPSCFEVGNEVREQFIDAARLTGAVFPLESFQAIPGKPQKYWANLYQLARSRLKNAGIQAIYGGEFCTFTQSEQFFSHRRDGVSGRFAALIWLETP
ncbi:MAG: peptidoglycan editing factor PgeF, partial [Polynucleobacter sp.]